MNKTWFVLALLCLAATAPAAGYLLAEISPQSALCIDCHKRESPVIYEQWGDSKHFRGNIGCFECHKAEKEDPDVYEHYGEFIATIVSPKDCARCHEKEVAQFPSSHHSKAARILGSTDNILAEVVEGNKGFISPMFPMGISAAAVNGCWQCHGSEVKVMGRARPRHWLAQLRHRTH